ncbi:DUF5709 domain-containing protein [Streptomyces sp. NPDC054871]
MSDQNRADDAYQPTGDNEEQEDAAPLDLDNAVDERTYDDMLDEGYSPPEKPLGVTRTGTTATEQHEGETLDERLRQEMPDAAPDEGAHADTAAQTVATDEGIDGGAAGAEEAAVHVVPDEDLPPARGGPD